MSNPASDDFRFSIRVYYEDTDAGGVVYYANYLKFFERARTEWLRALGVEQRVLAEETGCIFVVRGIEAQYRRPAALDDLLTIRSKVSRLGKASIDFSQFCERGDELLAAGKVQVGCVDRATMRPRALPAGLARTLAPLAAEPATD
ncbi:tol-pal system-associated acyl-CoA thioesterase [Pigmentiphaga sp. NML080357]|uniref:tol-pal system-associated acyl-CoA thioesterase n=1 Tax=Pigmentiphaga sp. NML080357 TaxID=2008675 RepID=UPI000B417828|nr:tol-pal system-associated acyl-CoA thioesterase [Pigmentiphaga sp. NML080357]OVZ57597.1 tol-pal system-associated acyl-CoA thioesterase [Pigmentiphaga sp. NML080357]